MARGRAYRFSRFGRGLNTTDGAYGLKEGYEDDPSGLGAEARALLNVVSRHRGNVRRRDGCDEIATLADPLKDLSAIGQDAAGFAVASDTAGALFAIDSGTPAVVTTLIASGLSTTAVWTFLRLPGSSYGPAYGMNGVDTPRETDGTLAGTGTWTATAGAVPNGTHMTYHENRVMVVGVAATPYRLFACAPGDPRDWDTAGNAWAVDFAPDDGSPLVATASFNSYALVFKERGIWVVYDSETGANRKIADGVGTLAAKSVVSTELGCFFLDAQRGVMLTDGSETRRVSEQIRASLNRIPAANQAAAVGSFLNGHYYLAIENEDGDRVIYDYDTELGSWWLHNPEPTVPEAGGVYEVFKDGETTDAGATYESYWSGPYHTFGSETRKRCREIHLDGRGTVDVYVATDYLYARGDLEDTASFNDEDDEFAGGGVFGGEGTFGGTVEIGEDSIFSLGTARSWSLTVHSDEAAYWELDAYTARIDHRKD